MILTVVAILLVSAAVAVFGVSLGRAAGRPRPKPPQIEIDLGDLFAQIDAHLDAHSAGEAP